MKREGTQVVCNNRHSGKFNRTNREKLFNAYMYRMFLFIAMPEKLEELDLSIL